MQWPGWEGRAGGPLRRQKAAPRHLPPSLLRLPGALPRSGGTICPSAVPKVEVGRGEGRPRSLWKQDLLLERPRVSLQSSKPGERAVSSPSHGQP